MLVVKSFADNSKPQSGGTYQGWEMSPLCGYGLNVMELLPTYHRFAVCKCNQVRKSYNYKLVALQCRRSGAAIGRCQSIRCLGDGRIAARGRSAVVC